MSDAHKAALAKGRAEGRAIREYLQALEATKPKRGRKRTPESIAKRLDRIEVELADADLMKRVDLIQERMDLQAELESMGTTVDIAKLERQFAKVAKAYSARKKISYAAWREAGVPASALKAAGISRGAA